MTDRPDEDKPLERLAVGDRVWVWSSFRNVPGDYKPHRVQHVARVWATLEDGQRIAANPRFGEGYPRASDGMPALLDEHMVRRAQRREVLGILGRIKVRLDDPKLGPEAVILVARALGIITEQVVLPDLQAVLAQYGVVDP